MKHHTLKFLERRRKQKFRFLFLFSFFYFMSQNCLAQTGSEPNFNHYIVVAENLSGLEGQPVNKSLNPFDSIKVHFSKAMKDVDLTKWITIDKPLRKPKEKYDRVGQFGSWIVDSRQANCLNTRARVLVRDSLTPVQFSESNSCSVIKGEWRDETTNQTYQVAKDVDVDHVVPLKNAYSNGAWRWSPTVKCMYANFMGNNFHLVPMSGQENKSKGDQGPEGYMPRDKSHSCQYLQKWLTIKAIWKLALTPDEASAIQGYLDSEKCDLTKFKVSEDFIQLQRKWVYDNRDICLR